MKVNSRAPEVGDQPNLIMSLMVLEQGL